MTKEDRFTTMRECMAKLSDVVQDVQSDQTAEDRLESELAGILLGMLQRFSTTGSLGLPRKSIELTLQYLKAQKGLGDIELAVNRVAALGGK